MEKTDGKEIRKIIGKKIYVELTSGRKYTGLVKDIDREGSPVIFIYLTDKFGEDVIFPTSEIKFLEVEK